LPVIEFRPSISDQNALEESQGNMVRLTKCDGVKRDTATSEEIVQPKFCHLFIHCKEISINQHLFL